MSFACLTLAAVSLYSPYPPAVSALPPPPSPCLIYYYVRPTDISNLSVRHKFTQVKFFSNVYKRFFIFVTFFFYIFKLFLLFFRERFFIYVKCICSFVWQIVNNY